MAAPRVCLILLAGCASAPPAAPRRPAGLAQRIGATAATTLSGASAKSYFGFALDRAGDVNGDGYGDLIVGAWAEDGYSGAARLYLGGAAGLAAAPNRVISAAPTEISVGYSVAGVGDVDGDGYDDVVVGAPYAGSFAGQAVLYRGSASGLGARPVTTITGAVTYDELGSSVAAAGDVNGDGYPDLIVGAQGDETQPGRAMVYLGGAGGLDTTPIAEWNADVAEDRFGQHVAGAGDLNGDGFDEVLVSAPFWDSETGAVSVYLGGADGPGAAPHIVLRGAAAGDAFGWRADGAGDVNGDGFDDLIVGACGSGDNTGAVTIYYGGPDGLDEGDADTWAGATPGAAFGLSVAGAGDVNGDGYADVVIGAPLATRSTGEAMLFQGSAAGIDTTPADSATGGAVNDLFGYTVAGAGDVNGDGLSDVAFGAYGAAAYAGEVDVFHGYDEADADADGVGAEEDCDDLDAAVGAPDTWYTDADGDGYGDPGQPSAACAQPSDAVGDASDCDDGDAAAHPGGEERCDGADNDCDGAVDNDAIDAVSFYADADGDGFGDAGRAESGCAPPAGFTDDASDCDDADGAAFPGAAEVAGDGVDQDCDGADLPADTGDADTGAGGPKARGCGCTSGGGAHTAAGLGLIAAAGLARRRRR